MTAPTPRPGTVEPLVYDPTVIREIRVEKSGEPYLYEDGQPIVGMWDVTQTVWRLLIEGVALRTAHQKASALAQTWHAEAAARGPEDTLITSGAASMLDHALAVKAPQPVWPYTSKVEGGRVWASCACGESKDWPDKGMGRAHFGAWKTQHRDCVAP